MKITIIEVGLLLLVLVISLGGPPQFFNRMQIKIDILLNFDWKK